MADKDYRDTIVDAVNLLSVVENRIFTAMINIGMYGVHKDVHESFELGDQYTFELSMFEDTNDANLDQLVSLLKQIATTRGYLMNINAINEDEVSDDAIDFE